MMHAANLKPHNNNPTAIFLWAVTGYVALLALANFLQSEVLKTLSYTVSFAIFMLMAAIAAFLPDRKSLFVGLGFALNLYYYGIIGSTVYNIDHLDWSVTLKMLMGPLFVLFGASIEAQSYALIWRNKYVKSLFMLLIILPSGLWIWQLVSGRAIFTSSAASTFGVSNEVSFFANRNSAAIYPLTLFTFYNVLSGKPVKNFLIYFFSGAIFKTLGVFFATLISLMLTVARDKSIKFGVLIIIAAIAILYVVNPTLSIISRFTPVIDTFLLIVTGRIDLKTVSFGELVATLHTTDLSFIFRLKHWLNLLDIYVNGSIFDWVFGFGTGSSVQMADIHLPPHNDYLRYLFECGIVAFTGFVLLIGLIIFNCGRRWESVPFLAIIVYFFSENLIDNFVAMMVFYFCAGVLAQRIQTENLALRCQKV